MRSSQQRLAAAALSIALWFGACGGGNLIKSFRLALASSGPLVSSLVAAGAIPGNKANAIIADFDAGAACGLTLQQEFAVIPKDAVDATPLKLAASTKAFKCFRVVIDRQNFAAHPRIQQIANIADGILASLVIFYTPSQTASIRDEKAFEREMKTKVEALEKAMQP